MFDYILNLQQFGEITEYITDPSTPSIALNYRSRKEAEVALLKGKHFQDRTLSITWCTEAQLSSAQRSPHTRTVVLTSSVIPTNNNASTAVIPKSASNNNTSHASTPSSEEAKGAASALPTWAPVSPAWCPLSPSWCPPSPFYGPFSPKWAAERSDKADEVERASSDDKQVQVAEAGAEEGAELDADDVTEPNTSEDQLLEGDDEVIGTHFLIVLYSNKFFFFCRMCLESNWERNCRRRRCCRTMRRTMMRTRTALGGDKSRAASFFHFTLFFRLFSCDLF